jgi:hypothetical protein
LWLYLYRDCATAFNDLSSEQARAAFRDFVMQYNGGELEGAYYAPTLPAGALEECKTTRHSWGFKISDQEDKSLHMLQEGVRKQTEYQASSVSNNDINTSRAENSVEVELPSTQSRINALTREERIPDRVANRRLREHVRVVDEELTGGRKDGHERQIEKRKELSAKIHGAAAHEREVELNDDALYGGDSSEYARMLAAAKQRTAANEVRKNARIADLQKNEVNRQNAMLESLGLSHRIGEKIQIKPREDTS